MFQFCIRFSLYVLLFCLFSSPVFSIMFDTHLSQTNFSYFKKHDQQKIKSIKNVFLKKYLKDDRLRRLAITTVKYANNDNNSLFEQLEKGKNGSYNLTTTVFPRLLIVFGSANKGPGVCLRSQIGFCTLYLSITTHKTYGSFNKKDNVPEQIEESFFRQNQNLLQTNSDNNLDEYITRRYRVEKIKISQRKEHTKKITNIHMQIVASWILILHELEVQLKLKNDGVSYSCNNYHPKNTLNEDNYHTYHIRCSVIQQKRLEEEIPREIKEESDNHNVPPQQYPLIF